MILGNLYKNDITRPLNPAVSVTDNSASTVKVEIEEYVFTDEILNGLYNVLNAVRNRSVTHSGIWINGYYGSGKSHFLKYLNFCLSPEHRDYALGRMLDAVKNDFDPLMHQDSKLVPTLADFYELEQWLKKAEIDTVLFNMGDKIGDSTNARTTFAKAIWEEFNGFRGFHKFSIALAQYLEKPLQEKGKFEAFKAALADDGFDWEQDAETLAITELDYVMEKAAEVASFSTDVIRNHIANSTIDATPEKLSEEQKRHIATKGDNYRILFFIDEVSQFGSVDIVRG